MYVEFQMRPYLIKPILQVNLFQLIKYWDVIPNYSMSSQFQKYLISSSVANHKATKLNEW